MVRFARHNDTWSTNIGWKWQFCQLARNFLKLAQSHPYCWAPRVWVACVGMVLSHALWCYQHSWKMQQRTIALYLRCFSGSEARKMKRSGYRFVSEALKVGSGDRAIVKICIVVQYLLVACPACRPSSWWPGPNITAWHFYHPSAQSEINLASRQPWQPPAILSHSRQSGSVGWAKPGRAGRGIGAR